MKKIITLLSIFIALSCFAQKADSLFSHPQPKYILQGVSVVAEKPTQAIGKIETKSWDDNEVVTETNIADAVTDVTGINISKGGKSGSELSIRGFNKEDVMIMMDGRPIGGGYFDAVDLTTIPISEIKEIQVIKGPASSLYGSNTMGGVVNIVSKKPDNSAWLKAAMQIRRNNTNKFQLSSSHSFDDYNYLFSIARYHTDGFMLSEDFQPVRLESGGVRDRTAKEQYDLSSRLNYNLGDFHTLGFAASYTWMDFREIPVSTDDYYNPTYPDAIFKKYVDWKRYQFSTNAMFQLAWNQKLNIDLYYDGYDDTYQTFKQPDYTDLSLDSRLLSWNIGAICKYTIELDAFDLISGYRAERQAFNRKDNQSYSEWTSNWQLLQNPFIQSEFVFDKLTLSAGSGFSLFHQNDRDNWIFHIEPSLGFFYKTDSFSEYNLAFSNNVNYPSLHELFSASSGNPDLKEESAWKAELSTVQPFTFGSIPASLESSIFYNIVENLIDKVEQPNYALVYQNIDQVQSYGLEAAFRIKYISEHYLQYRYLEYKEDSDLPLNENPRNIVNFSEKIRLPYSILFEYEANWNDIAHSDGHTLPSYWLHNFYLSTSLERYKIKLGLENALDENYQDKYGYPQPGYDFILSLETEIF